MNQSQPRRILLSVILFTTLLLPCRLANADLADNIDRLLPALARVESRNDPKAVGDGGAAIGIYQIHQGYWQDAVDFDKSLGGSYNDCFNPEYAERVVRAYLKRYAPVDATVEQLARIHNGGCNILKKQHSKKAKEKKAWDNTTKYWNKIKKEL
jgi:hypothetical protein